MLKLIERGQPLPVAFSPCIQNPIYLGITLGLGKAAARPDRIFKMDALDNTFGKRRLDRLCRWGFDDGDTFRLSHPGGPVFGIV